MNKIKYKLSHIFKKSQPTITYLIIFACVFVWILQLLFPKFVYSTFAFVPFLALTHPWTFITTGFLHATDPLTFFPVFPDFFHILFNMYSLYIVGTVLEPMFGRIRFSILYFLSLFASTLAVFITAMSSSDYANYFTITIGASGAIFGLFGALIFVFKRIGANANPIMFVVGLNLLMPLFISNLAWQAHIGGFIAGIIISFIMVDIIPKIRYHINRKE
ncbi:MAG: rhomboid family intramembrane serine protease [Bifidobacteriaceae bacterium]|jgi:membrane associated rhomboid family serine protease|nr:rhomboid family intramembrane serine protease [Bifidobacteriaceae bacterium]